MLNTKEISLQTLVVQSPGNIVSDMDGNKVMLSIQNGKYYNLGEVGGVIWELIESPITICELVKRLVNEFEVGESDCSHQVFTFITQLYGEGLINIKEVSMN